MKKEVSDYLKKIASRGGAAGTGDSKRRSPEHYQKMVKARLAKKKKAGAKNG